MAQELIPWGEQADDEIPTDACQIWRILTGKDAKELRQAGEPYVRDVRRYDPTFTVDQAWFVQADDTLGALFDDWRTRLDQRQFDQAVPLFEKFILSAGITNGERTLFLDEMASLVAVGGHKELLPHGLRWAREAHRLAPASRTVRGTLGSLLVEAGDVKAGIALLEPLVSEDNDPYDRAVAVCYLAKAHHLLGDRDAAARLLAAGREYQTPSCVYDRIQKEITSSS